MDVTLNGRKVLLGVSGGIAAYKVCDLARKLRKLDAELRVVLTSGAEEFVKPTLFSALTGSTCYTNMDFFRSDGSIPHVELARFPELIILAPATASLISKLCSAQASELLLAILLATKAPVLVFPSMNTNMYRHPAVQANLERLKSYGYYVFPPVCGSLACMEEGEGRLPEPDEIVEIAKCFFKTKDLLGRSFLITSGPTKEYLDQVRFITNGSTGLMGYLIAREVYARGGKVYLVWGGAFDPVFPNLEPLHGVEKPNVLKVKTTEEMWAASKGVFSKVDVAIFAAAPCDFQPETVYHGKLKKRDSLGLTLRQTVDIAQSLKAEKTKQLMVGFALEEEETLEVYARKKLAQKGFDLVVANPLTAMGSSRSRFIILDAERCLNFDSLTKEALAKELVDQVALKLHGNSS